MTERITEWDTLMALVDEWLAQHDRRFIECVIIDAHNGRPDGTLVTEDNEHLIRRFRNRVSADPNRLIEEAQSWASWRALSHRGTGE